MRDDENRNSNDVPTPRFNHTDLVIANMTVKANHVYMYMNL